MSTATVTSTGSPVSGTSTSAQAAPGGPTAAMAATGIPPYWERFGPLAPGFLHAATPNPYRLGDDDPVACSKAAIDSIEALVAREGAETIAAVIAEPVQGAGGVIIPP